MSQCKTCGVDKEATLASAKKLLADNSDLRQQLDSRDAEVDRLKGMVDEIHAARKVVNQHDKLLVQIHTLRQQLAKAGMS